jgi:Cu2+-exporting ATPase
MLKKCNYTLLGLTCLSCAESAEKIINKQPGVNRAKVHFATKTVELEFEEKKVNFEKIKSELNKLGYSFVLNQNETAAIEEKIKLELRNQSIIALLFSGLVIYLHMFVEHSGYNHFLQFLCSLPVVFYAGRRIYTNAFKQLFIPAISMDSLIALGTGIAFAFSVFQLFLGDAKNPQIYFESATAVIAFVLLGKWIEETALHKGNLTFDALLALRQLKCKVWRQGNWVVIDNFNIQKGDKTLVRKGERIPIDGLVLEGASYIDESMITGEPLPVSKSVNDLAIAGSINIGDDLVLEAICNGAESSLQKIIEQVQYSQSNKVRAQRIADEIVKYFIPGLLVLAFIVFGVQFTLSKDWYYSFERALTVLVVSCPCALGLATPIVIKSAISAALRKGALIKDSTVLERLYQTDILCWDKTGTLTAGKPQIVNKSVATDKADYLIELALKSQHPLSKAIYKDLQKDYNAFGGPLLSQEVIGKGVIGKIGKDEIILGKREFLLEKNYDFSSFSNYEPRGTTVWAGVNKKVVAFWEFEDPIHPLAKQSIDALRRLKPQLNIYLLTGDKEEAANKAAAQVGIPKENVKFNLLPQQKAGFLKECKEKNKVVTFIGDGHNDAIALSEASIGISLSGGTDLAQQIASVTLMNNHLILVPQLFQLSQKVRVLIQQNLLMAFGYNLITLPLAIGLIKGWELPPVLAGAAMMASSLSVLLNSFRIDCNRLY